jgi:hypothetical protein
MNGEVTNVQKVIEEKHLARINCLNRRTRINQNNYNKKRKIASGVCSIKKEGMAK